MLTGAAVGAVAGAAKAVIPSKKAKVKVEMKGRPKAK